MIVLCSVFTIIDGVGLYSYTTGMLMGTMDLSMVLAALRATGRAMETAGVRCPIIIVIGGSVAGLLANDLEPPRTTDDCDVIWSKPLDQWSMIEAAASRVADEFGLPRTWLNDDSRVHAWSLPIGWRNRCQLVERTGPLEVLRLDRFDLIASKVMSAPARPHDLEDLLHLRPTRDELLRLAEHLDRLEAEDLDRTTYDEQRGILGFLRGTSA